jgi:Zn finger protein HypA/HybF involved in hydrogenase expression
MTEVHSFNRTLDQELTALIRRASLECPACGEFVVHRHGDIECPECGLLFCDRKAQETSLQLGLQAG